MLEESTGFDAVISFEKPNPQLYVALRLLLAAYDKADALQCGGWEQPLRIRALRAAGIENRVLRRLVDDGLVEIGIELTSERGGRTAFRRCRQASFCERSCFVLTNDGLQAARRVAMEFGGDRVPRWDAEMRELRVGDWVVKRFRRPAPDQEVVLTVLEEQGWAKHVEDPLSPQHGQDPKQRFHDTLKRLNKGQKPRLIRFMGDGQGTGLRWELV
jgi:hypothetical protein